MTVSNNLFALPKRSAAAAGDNSFKIKPYKLWVEALPTGNAGQTAKELYGKLKQMNRVKIAPQERVELLYLLDEPIRFVLDTLSSRYFSDPPPLKQRNKTAAELVYALCVLAVQGYKIAVEEFAAGSLLLHMRHKGEYVGAFHNALYYLGRMLLHGFQIYRSPPPKLWMELHRLYLTAVDAGLHDRVLGADASLGSNHEATATHLYKQVLLLAIAGPWRMQQGEVTKLHKLVEQWAHKVDLIPIADAGDDQGLFVVDALSDDPPKYRTLQQNNDEGVYWILDIERLTKHMEVSLSSDTSHHGSDEIPPTLNHSSGISAELLGRLMLSWGAVVTRHVDRKESSGEVLISSGIDTLFFLFGGDDLDIDGKSGNNYMMPGGVGNSTGPLSHGESEKSRVSFISGEEHAAAMSAKLCRILDESAGGFHLGWMGSGSPIRVGELVAIQPHAGEGENFLGVVRWIRADLDSMINFGVELLHGRVDPVILCKDRKGESREYIRGLMHTTEQKIQTLITMPFFSTAMDRFSLSLYGTERPITIQKQIEGSASFIQVGYCDYSQPGGQRRRSKGSDEMQQTDELSMGEELDFEELWSTL